MEWLRLPFAFLLVLLTAFGTSFLSAAWERRRKRKEELEVLLAHLPGYDCGLCGSVDCRRFARSIQEYGGDPGLCAPGGSQVERSIRAALTDDRAKALMAFVRCGKTSDRSKILFDYDGRRDCRAAAGLFSGPDNCVEACIGLGSCARICPVGAIRIEKDLARVDPLRCTGCGKCLSVCPTGVLCLVPASSRWQVACNSHRSAEEKNKDCENACTGCGECVRISTSWEFSLTSNLAKASEFVACEGTGCGDWENLARHCPNKAIVLAGDDPKRSEEAQALVKKR